MTKQARDFWTNMSAYGALVLLASLGVYVAFQWHATLVYVGLRAVESPAVNRLGWNTATINGLSRFLYLVIGAVWLFAVILLPGFLQEAARGHRLRSLVFRLLLVVGALYGVSYLVLRLL